MADEPAPLDPAAIESVRRRFPMPKFFIFGYPRSGTTLLMRLVRLHPEVHCNRQAHFFTYPQGAAQALSDGEVQEWLNRPSNRWTAGKQLDGVLVRLAADFILESEAEALGKKVVGDKSPTIIGGLAVRRLHAIYPDARLIYLVRDGRDAAVSRRFQRFIDQPQNLTRADRRIRKGLAENRAAYSAEGKSIFTAEFL
ncbi:MAG: sulfotransferase, partial [Anaerolineales bacterium]|nr:sulfotransferase [Anaerolineales bacterium]